MAKEGLGFGYKSVEELEAADAAKGQSTETVKEEVKTEPVIETGKEKVEPPKAEVKKEEPKVVEPLKTSWLDEVNKNFKSEFKSPEEFGQVFEKTKKVSEYETKLKGYEESDKNYKKQIEDLQSSLKKINPLELFSSPEAFVAEQLKKQRPDLNPGVLQDVVTKDSTVMDDLDVLVKNELLINPGLKGGEQGVKEYLCNEYGIDTSLPKEEWSIALQNKLMIKANQVRREWNELKSKVEVPKVQTPEEREAERVRLQAEKQVKIAPLRDSFSKFDKFTEEIEEGVTLDLIVPDEYKEVLPKMFDTYFLEAGLDVNEDTLKSMDKLKRALYLESNIKQIYKVIEGDVRTRVKAEYDALLNNTNPSNTKTATELGDNDHQKFSNEYGLGKMFGKQNK